MIKLIRENSRVTQQAIAERLGINNTPVAKDLIFLKEKNIVIRMGSNKNGEWKGLL